MSVRKKLRVFIPFNFIFYRSSSEGGLKWIKTDQNSINFNPFQCMRAIVSTYTYVIIFKIKLAQMIVITYNINKM